MKDSLLLAKKTSKKILRQLTKRKKYILYWVFVLLVSSFLVVSSITGMLVSNIQNNSIAFDPLVGFSPKPYPQFQSVLGLQSVSTEAAIMPSFSARAAIVMDDDSKVVLFAKNPTLRFSMASTTKIMTALTALSYYNKTDVLTVKTATVEGSIVGFKDGEQIIFEDLLYGLLLPSGNDAALAIAQNYPGGVLAFVAKMNENAKKYNLLNTHFADPAGLVDEQDYTTVIDLARLASIAMKNEEFTKIVSTKKQLITDVSGRRVYKLENLNKLLDYPGINGIKTGFTDEAGGVLATSYKQDGHRFIVVVMKSEDRFADTIQLVELLKGNVTYKSTNLE